MCCRFRSPAGARDRAPPGPSLTVASSISGTSTAVIAAAAATVLTVALLLLLYVFLRQRRLRLAGQGSGDVACRTKPALAQPTNRRLDRISDRPPSSPSSGTLPHSLSAPKHMRVLFKPTHTSIQATLSGRNSRGWGGLPGGRVRSPRPQPASRALRTTAQLHAADRQAATWAGQRSAPSDACIAAEKLSRTFASSPHPHPHQHQHPSSDLGGSAARDWMRDQSVQVGQWHEVKGAAASAAARYPSSSSVAGTGRASWKANACAAPHVAGSQLPVRVSSTDSQLSRIAISGCVRYENSWDSTTNGFGGRLREKAEQGASSWPCASGRGADVPPMPNLEQHRSHVELGASGKEEPRSQAPGDSSRAAVSDACPMQWTPADASSPYTLQSCCAADPGSLLLPAPQSAASTAEASRSTTLNLKKSLGQDCDSSGSVQGEVAEVRTTIDEVETCQRGHPHRRKKRLSEIAASPEAWRALNEVSYSSAASQGNAAAPNMLHALSGCGGGGSHSIVGGSDGDGSDAENFDTGSTYSHDEGPSSCTSIAAAAAAAISTDCAAAATHSLAANPVGSSGSGSGSLLQHKVRTFSRGAGNGCLEVQTVSNDVEVEVEVEVEGLDVHDVSSGGSDVSHAASHRRPPCGRPGSPRSLVHNNSSGDWLSTDLRSSASTDCGGPRASPAAAEAHMHALPAMAPANDAHFSTSTGHTPNPNQEEEWGGHPQSHCRSSLPDSCPAAASAVPHGQFSARYSIERLLHRHRLSDGVHELHAPALQVESARLSMASWRSSQTGGVMHDREAQLMSAGIGQDAWLPARDGHASLQQAVGGCDSGDADVVGSAVYSVGGAVGGGQEAGGSARSLSSAQRKRAVEYSRARSRESARTVELGAAGQRAGQVAGGPPPPPMIKFHSLPLEPLVAAPARAAANPLYRNSDSSSPGAYSEPLHVEDAHTDDAGPVPPRPAAEAAASAEPVGPAQAGITHHFSHGGYNAGACSTSRASSGAEEPGRVCDEHDESPRHGALLVHAARSSTGTHHSCGLTSSYTSHSITLPAAPFEALPMQPGSAALEAAPCAPRGAPARVPALGDDLARSHPCMQAPVTASGISAPVDTACEGSERQIECAGAEVEEQRVWGSGLSQGGCSRWPPENRGSGEAEGGQWLLRSGVPVAVERQSSTQQVARQLDSFSQMQLLLGKWELLEARERRFGGQAVVQFAVCIESNCRCAVKFFLDRNAFEAESALYGAFSPALCACPNIGNAVRRVRIMHEASSPIAAPLSFLPKVEALLDGSQGELLDAKGNSLPPCIVMERGESLQEWAERTEPDLRKVFTALSSIAAHIADMHECSYVHGNIKPSNVLWLPRQGAWRAVDFATACRIGTEAPAVLRALGYAAPEIVQACQQGERSLLAGAAADAWSVGVLAFELLYGAPALNVSELGHTKVLEQLAGGAPLPWEEVPGVVMAPIGAFEEPVLQLLQREPDRRPPLRQFQADCLRVLESLLGEP